MAGRRAVGPELALRMDGSESARERAHVILRTLAGDLPVQDACAELGICVQRFDRIRTSAIQAMVASLEPQRCGRKPNPADPVDPARVAELESRVAELELALVRAELAAALPQLGARTGKSKPRASRPRPGTR